MKNPEQRRPDPTAIDPQKRDSKTKEGKVREPEARRPDPANAEDTSKAKKKVKRPGFFHRKMDDAFGGFFGATSRWDKELAHIDSLSDKEVTKEADAERAKIGISKKQNEEDIAAIKRKIEAIDQQPSDPKKKKVVKVIPITQPPRATVEPKTTPSTPSEAQPTSSATNSPEAPPDAGDEEIVKATADPASTPAPPEKVVAPVVTPEPVAKKTAPEAALAVEAENAEVENTYEIFDNDPKVTILSPEGVLKGKKFGESEGDLTPEKMFEQADIIAIGDMHASALKFIEQGMQAGLIDMEKADAKEFLSVYKQMAELGKNPLLPPPVPTYDKSGQIIPFEFEHPTKETWNAHKIQHPHFPFHSEADKNAFAKFHERAEQLIDTITVTEAGKDKELVLLGDLISDRGLSDYLVHGVLKKLRKETKPVVIASNHDMEPLFRLLKIPMSVDATERVSFYRAARINNDKMTSETEQHYRTMQLFHYNPDKKLFFSHAPITRELIAELKNSCGFSENIDSPTSMVKFVEAANTWFSQTIADTYDRKEDAQRGAKFHLIQGLIWERDGLTDETVVPFNQTAVEGYIHGHDSESKTKNLGAGSPWKSNKPNTPTVYNIDNRHRKRESVKDLDPTKDKGASIFFTA